MAKAKKVAKWEDLNEDTRDKITILRKKEEDLIEQSGYRKIFKGALYGCAFFISIVLFKFRYFVQKFNLTNPKNISAFILIPTCSYISFLHYLYFDVNKYREYYQTHIELNRVIKLNVKSSHYK